MLDRVKNLSRNLEINDIAKRCLIIISLLFLLFFFSQDFFVFKLSIILLLFMENNAQCYFPFSDLSCSSAIMINTSLWQLNTRRLKVSLITWKNVTMKWRYVRSVNVFLGYTWNHESKINTKVYWYTKLSSNLLI